MRKKLQTNAHLTMRRSRVAQKIKISRAISLYHIGWWDELTKRVSEWDAWEMSKKGGGVMETSSQRSIVPFLTKMKTFSVSQSLHILVQAWGFCTVLIVVLHKSAASRMYLYTQSRLRFSSEWSKWKSRQHRTSLKKGAVRKIRANHLFLPLSVPIARKVGLVPVGQSGKEGGRGRREASLLSNSRSQLQRYAIWPGTICEGNLLSSVRIYL